MIISLGGGGLCDMTKGESFLYKYKDFFENEYLKKKVIFYAYNFYETNNRVKISLFEN